MRKSNTPGKQQKILAAAITATSLMTMCSYIISQVTHNNFKEPDILSQLTSRHMPNTSKKYANITGWSLHYLVGLLFAELYAPFWNKPTPKSTLKKGLMLGGMSGVAAILIWKWTLDMHPDPPYVNFPGFAIQLFVVHLVFAVCAGRVYHYIN